MATHFELWNDRTNNLLDEFDTIEQALDEVRWRISERGDDAGRALSLLQLDGTGAIKTVVNGDELVRRSREMTIVGD
ncbi:MAG: hypothetical protein M3Y58_02415 [Chloroflexota bacterium]|nr:hypothetical protein [Chloroflexota bacterium]